MNRVSVSNKVKGEVMFEGELGGLVGVQLIEGIVLEITGKNGVIRIDITEKELFRALSKKR